MAGAQRAVLRVGSPVDVLDPVGSLVGGGAAPLDVDDQMRLGADVPTEANELVRPEVARLALVLPGEVDPLRPLVARPDAPDPVIVLGDVAARPADERRAQRLDPLEDVRAHVVDRVVGNERDLIEPHAAAADEEEREPAQRIRPRWTQREAVLTPRAIGRHRTEVGFRVDLAVAAILLQRRLDPPGEIPRADPDRPPVTDAGANRQAILMHAARAAVLRGDLDAQRMLDLLLARRTRWRIGAGLIPHEPNAIVVAIVGVALPVPRQAARVRRFLETAVAQQLGVQAELDVLEHELGELPVEPRADRVLDGRRVDRDAGAVSRPILARSTA